METSQRKVWRSAQFSTKSKKWDAVLRTESSATFWMSLALSTELWIEKNAMTPWNVYTPRPAQVDPPM